MKEKHRYDDLSKVAMEIIKKPECIRHKEERRNMNNSFSVMTDKMQMLYMDIVASLGQLPEEQKGFIFGYEGEEDYDWIHAVACYIALEFVKYSFDYSDPQFPLRHFLQDVDDDSERMMQQRIMQYVIKYKKQEIEMKGGDISPNDRFANLNMDEIDSKLKGYRITEMNYLEQQNIHDLEIIKSIVERRIVSSKKVSNARFVEIMEQYDEFVESLIERSKKSDKDLVFASLAFFTLEWHYPIEFFYFLTNIMEEERIDAIDQDALVLLCGYVNIESRFGGWFSTESRMVKGRILVSPLLFGREADRFSRETMKDLLKEILVLITKYTEVVEVEDGRLYKDWFREESSLTDWASFFRFYDVFAIWQRKEWTPKRIQKMRYLFESTLSK